jgi:N-acetylglucosamine kinase-like BadF-type ATPase
MIRMDVIGLNGIDLPEEYAMQHGIICKRIGIPADRVVLVNDGIAALWGATCEPAAAIIQQGSGFTAALRTRYGNETLFDHLNIGRNFSLRNELITLVARMIDGRAKPSPLKDAVLRHLGIGSKNEYAEAIYTGKARKNIRTMLPLVFQAWLKGDAAAADLVQHMTKDLAITAKRMSQLTGASRPPVFFGGGVIANAPEPFWDLLVKCVRKFAPHVRMRRPAMPPELGAAVMAAFRSGKNPVKFFMKGHTCFEKEKLL